MRFVVSLLSPKCTKKIGFLHSTLIPYIHTACVSETGKEMYMEIIYSPTMQQQGMDPLNDGITCPDFAGSCPRQVACLNQGLPWCPVFSVNICPIKIEVSQHRKMPTNKPVYWVCRGLSLGTK